MPWVGHHRNQLVQLLRETPSDRGLRELIKRVEQEQPGLALHDRTG